MEEHSLPSSGAKGHATTKKTLILASAFLVIAHLLASDEGKLHFSETDCDKALLHGTI